MLKYVRSNAVSFLALFVALGGTSYAALTLPSNSVGTKQLRRGAVTAEKVRTQSLLAQDFKAGQLPRGRTGPRGQQGVQGVQGVAGTARAYALVDSNGSFVAGIPHPGFSAVTGAFTISLASPLPPLITNSVTIDSTTEATFIASTKTYPIISLFGGSAGVGANGVEININNSTVKGLNLRNFSGDGA